MIRPLRTALLALTFVVGLGATASAVRGEEPQVVPRIPAHSHNDYEQPRPLLDALDHGFCSIEADIFLTPQGLLVGHTPLNLRPDRTLEKLYLNPLRDRVRKGNGRVYPGGPTIFLLIDVKTNAKSTCTALLEVLKKYDDILSVEREGKFEPRAITVVVSGNSDRDTLTHPSVRYAGIDGRPEDLDSEVSAHAIPWISTDWEGQFKWRGEGAMPETERAKLHEFVRKAHNRGRLARFWATPEKPAVWTELLAAGVDLIGTDELAKLEGFLRDQSAKQPATEVKADHYFPGICCEPTPRRRIGWRLRRPAH